MSRPRRYAVQMSGRITRTITIMAYDSEEAEEKATELFGSGRLTDYEIDDAEVIDVDEDGPDRYDD